MGRVWDDVLGDLDRAIYAECGYGRIGGGGQRPALVVIDVTYDFVGDKPEPVLESMKKFRTSCGEAGWRSMEYIRDLLATCRELEIPIFYTKDLDDWSPVTKGAWGWKNPRAVIKGEQAQRVGNQIPDMIAPLPGEIVIQKTKPSAFFSTPLESYLKQLDVDTLIVTGCTTSGCIRATVLDSFSRNFRTIVPEEAVFDRGELPHKSNLYDMNSRYADVISVADTQAYLATLRSSRIATS